MQLPYMVTNVWRAIHVWELFMCGGDIHVQLPYMVTNVWRAIHVWELFTCGGDIHVQLPYTVTNVWRVITVWELFTCETSHQSEILHSLIFSHICFKIPVQKRKQF